MRKIFKMITLYIYLHKFDHSCKSVITIYKFSVQGFHYLSTYYLNVKGNSLIKNDCCTHSKVLTAVGTLSKKILLSLQYSRVLSD